MSGVRDSKYSLYAHAFFTLYSSTFQSRITSRTISHNFFSSPQSQSQTKRENICPPSMVQIPPRLSPRMGRRMRQNQHLRSRMAPRHWRKHGTTHHLRRWIPPPLQHSHTMGRKGIGGGISGEWAYDSGDLEGDQVCGVWGGTEGESVLSGLSVFETGELRGEKIGLLEFGNGG